MIRSYQIVTSLHVRIDSKKCVEGWKSIPLDPGNTRTHILPMHWTQQHRHWLTYLSWAPWKNVQAHMKQPIATSERRQFAKPSGNPPNIYICVYIYYIYMYEAVVWFNRRVRKFQDICTIWNPPVVSWFVNPINYSYMMLYVSQTI